MPALSAWRIPSAHRGHDGRETPHLRGFQSSLALGTNDVSTMASRQFAAQLPGLRTKRGVKSAAR
jgi:hypothetical protein